MLLDTICNSISKNTPLLLHHCTNKISSLCDCLTKDNYSLCWSYCCIHSIVLCTKRSYSTYYKLCCVVKQYVPLSAIHVFTCLLYVTCLYCLLYVSVSYPQNTCSLISITICMALPISTICTLYNISVNLSTIPQPCHSQLFSHDITIASLSAVLCFINFYVNALCLSNRAI